MNWIIKITNKAAKQVEKLPKSAKATLLLLPGDIERNGPTTGGGLKNYGKRFSLTSRYFSTSSIMLQALPKPWVDQNTGIQI